LRSPIRSVTARQSRSGREPNFAALSTGCHLYSAGRPSRWALADILVCFIYYRAMSCYGICRSRVSFCLSVCLSVISPCSTETTKRRSTQTTPHDSPGTLVYSCRRSRQNSNGVTHNGGAKCRWGRLKLATFDKSLAITRKHRSSQVYHTERPPLFAARLP